MAAHVMSMMTDRLSTMVLGSLSAADTQKVESIVDRLLRRNNKNTAAQNLSPAAERRLASREVSFNDAELIWLCQTCRKLFLRDSACISIKAPLKVCGDIHGQFYDLQTIFQKNGMPSNDNRYLFLGDYVDRGKQSLECIALLFCLKLLHPQDFHLLRGNHECVSLNATYGFYDECVRRTSPKVYKSFADAFDVLPVAAVVANRVFCCHGGLSPHLGAVSDINHNVKRPCDIGEQGLLCDLMWSDPSSRRVNGYCHNESRGVGHSFGPEQIDAFLTRNNFELIVRAHQVVEDGYEFYHNQKLITVFSAPNYCNEFTNSGATLVIDTELKVKINVIKGLTKKDKHDSSGSGGGAPRDYLDM